MPYERVILGPRYALRLEALRGEHAVEIECVQCGRRGLVAPHRLHDRFEAFMRLVDIARRMKCPHCGRRGCIEWTVVGARPPGSSLRR